MNIQTTASVVGLGVAIVALLFGGRGGFDAYQAWRRRRQDVRDVEAHDPVVVDLEVYRRRVTQAHTRLRFGDPTSLTGPGGVDGSESHGISLTDIYTPLSVATEFGVGEPRNVRPIQLRIPVEEALGSADARRAVVLGDPGAGKSTLVDFLVGEYLRAGFRGVPVHVRLSEMQQANPAGIWAAVLEVYDEGVVNATLCAQLEATLSTDGGLLLLDGLDEVPVDAVPEAIAAIVAASLRFADAQLVVTCRSYDYYLSEPSRQLPAEFVKWRLLPFTLEDMLSYVDRWYEVLSRLKFISNPVERKRNLQDALRNSPALEDLGSTPLLLALMAQVHTTSGELPSARAVLYHRAVIQLLADNPGWRENFVTEAVRQDELLSIVTAVAYEVQMREAASATRRIPGLTIAEIETIIRGDLTRRQPDETSYLTLHKAIGARLDRIVHSNGLLVQQVSGHYHFAHRSLQEFLAGMYLLNGADYPLALRLAADPQWHEPFVLMAGYGSRDGQSLFFLTRFIQDLATAKEATVDALILAGEMLAEIGKGILRSNRYDRLVDQSDAEWPLWRAISDRLYAERGRAPRSVGDSSELHRVLGRLGDPRYVDHEGRPIPLSHRLVELPRITIVIGDDGRDRPRAKSELVETAPLREVTLEGFAVSRFLVTNLEFAAFVNDGGYTSSEWWSTEGLQWLSGDQSFAEELQARTVEWIDRDFRAELKMGKFRMEDVLRDAAAMSRPRTEPFYWRNGRYNQENQPVVGVNWWEANAYCSYLTSRMRQAGELDARKRVSIPNEWEWERFARGVNDRRVFPWGSDEDTASRAHTRFDGLDLDAATPVGSFPLGRTCDGLLDVGGNVWEWTSSRALPMGVHHDADRHNVVGVTDIVVRGGSWFSDVDGAVRCGYRGIDLPQNVYYDVGLRVIIGNQPSGGR